MQFDEAWRHWQQTTSSPTLWLGRESVLEVVAAQLRAAGQPITALNEQLLARCPVSPDIPHDSALAEAFEAWLGEQSAESAPLVLARVELALAQRLGLERLASLPRRVLCLIPGGVRGQRPRLFGTAHKPGLPVPDWLTTWTEVEHDAA